jgi:hypothetical protein
MCRHMNGVTLPHQSVDAGPSMTSRLRDSSLDRFGNYSRTGPGDSASEFSALAEALSCDRKYHMVRLHVRRFPTQALTVILTSTALDTAISISTQADSGDCKRVPRALTGPFSRSRFLQLETISNCHRAYLGK